MKRKVAIVDLDNVIFPWSEIMATVLAGSTEVNQTAEGLIKLYHSWNIWDDFGVPKGIFDWYWEKAIEDGIMWGISKKTGMMAPPIPGAQTGLWRLSDAEWHIHLVTTRLVKFRMHDIAVRNTVDWLAAQAIPYRSLTFTEDKSLVHGDAIVDDNPNNLIEHPAPIKILYPAPHNEGWEKTGWEAEDNGIIQLTRDPDLQPWDEIVEILGSGIADSND